MNFLLNLLTSKTSLFIIEMNVGVYKIYLNNWQNSPASNILQNNFLAGK